MPDDATLDRILASVADRRAVIGALARGAMVWVPGVRVLFPSRGSEPYADFQALLAQVRRVIEAMAWLGEPFAREEITRVDAAAALTDTSRALAELRRSSMRAVGSSYASIRRVASRSREVKRARRSSSRGGGRSSLGCKTRRVPRPSLSPKARRHCRSIDGEPTRRSRREP